MPKIEALLEGNEYLLYAVYENPARKVYITKLNSLAYEALRLHFISEFLAQPAEKSFSELDTIYGHV